MSKVNIPTIAGGYNLSAINDAIQTIEDNLNDKVLYRNNPDGEPNAMSQALDMNSNQILNLPAPASQNSPARLVDVQPLVAGLAPASLVPFTPTGTLASTTVQSAIVELMNETASDKTALAEASVVTNGDALVATKRVVTGAVATTVHDWIEGQNLNTYSDFKIPRDGTDQTTALVSLVGVLAAYKGTVEIAQGTAFNEQTLADAIPTGLTVLWLTEHIDGSYVQKFRIRFSGDLVAHDSQDVEGSGYHPARAMWNTGKNTTDKSDSAARRYASEAHWVGWTPTFNGPIIGFFEQWAKHPDLNRWRKSWRVQTPLRIAMADTHGKWFTGKSFVIGEQVRNSGGFIYRATATGTSGVTEPTGTGFAINDGGVTWAYVQAQSHPMPRVASAVYGVNARVLNDNFKVYVATVGGAASAGAGPTGTGTGIGDGGVTWNYESSVLAVDRTAMDLDENGNVGAYSPAGTPQTLTLASGNTTHSFGIDDSTGESYWRHNTLGLDVARVVGSGAVRFSMANSPNWLNVSGTGPTAPVTGRGKVANGGATNMSTMVPTAGVSQMTVKLRFDNANTTLVHGTGGNALRLKGSVNVTVPVGGYVEFEYDSTDTASWRECGRSF